MILCFDIGNTYIDVSVFKNDIHTGNFRIAYEKGRTCWTYLGYILKGLQEQDIRPEDVEGSVVCSVVPDSTQAIYEALEIAFSHKPVLFDNNPEITGLTIKTDNPSEVGNDIIAGCMAVKANYRLPAIVVDMGTGTTLTAMDKDGSIIGVSIVAGVVAQLQTLNRRTDLPVDLNLTVPSSAIGKNTADSIASGTVLGNAYLIDGMIKAFEKEMGVQCHVYATGDISKVIMPLCEHECMINDSLLPEGMYMYYKNVKSR